MKQIRRRSLGAKVSSKMSDNGPHQMMLCTFCLEQIHMSFFTVKHRGKTHKTLLWTADRDPGYECASSPWRIHAALVHTLEVKDQS